MMTTKCMHHAYPFFIFRHRALLRTFPKKSKKGQKVKSRISALKCAVSGRHEFEIQSVATSSIAEETGLTSKILGSNELLFLYKIKVKRSFG